MIRKITRGAGQYVSLLSGYRSILVSTVEGNRTLVHDIKAASLSGKGVSLLVSASEEVKI